MAYAACPPQPQSYPLVPLTQLQPQQQPGYNPNPNAPPTSNVPPGYPNPQQGYPQPGGYGPAQPYGYGPQGGQPMAGGAPGGHPPVPPGLAMPVTTQPGGWMSIPQGIPNCPPGLEYLTMIDHVLVHQEHEILELLTGFETNNKYKIKNRLGQSIYYAVEDNDCLTRNCCGALRPFDMKVLDNFSNQVININRPLACDSCCFPCCLQSVVVSAPPGNVIGSVEQNWSICFPQFSIKDAFGETVLRIEGPFCTSSCCGSDVDFNVMTKDGQHQVGKISKQWTGLISEAFTDADNFGITFPMDLDVRMKAVMLGACFLIDMMFYDSTGSSQSRY